jgi:BirA family biotin operon repressor/biotin-[acetyl-CoA-carboxylase] ligase
VAKIEVFDTLPSTQTVALNRLQSGPEEPGWILAKEQTKGVGRHGRQWVGTKGNLMASRYEVMAMDVRSAPQLSFVTALAIYEMLRPLIPDTDAALRIKWPNDILYRGAKLCGILVQTEPSQRDGHLGVVIGIGMNVTRAPILEGYLTIDLRDIAPGAKTLDAEAVLVKINAHLDSVLNLWRDKGFDDIAKAWLKRAYGTDMTLKAVHDGVAVTGKLKGLDPFGGLQIIQRDGQVATITGGDVDYVE